YSTLALRCLHMRELAGAWIALFSMAVIGVANTSLPACTADAARYKPCELHFEWNPGELPAGQSPFHYEWLNVEFRGPDQTTYLIHPFWDGGNRLRARFTPDLAGVWHYRITSPVKRWEVRDATFTVADDSSPGWVSVANVRHWWTDNKQPHLWVSAEVPWLRLDQNAFQSFADARKADGFTHLRGVLLSGGVGGNGPLDANGNPNFAYFSKLDDRLLYANDRGFVLDLVLADENFVSTGVFDQWQLRDDLIKYVIARYSPLNVSWQGLKDFEDRVGNRALLKELAALLKKNDSFHHTMSTDARLTSSMLLRDGWENYIIEASPDPQLAAVERQFTAAPQVHIIQGVEPDAFRHELWLSTTNGEYPTMRYEASQNPANIAAMKTWITVMSGVRHWEFEPFYDVDGARAVGLDNVEYLLYAAKPGTVEIDFSEKHKYNPRWINPRTGEVTELKDVKQDTYSQTTPGPGDWILQVPRDGQKEHMLKSYKFESVPAPEQVPELNAKSIPFEIEAPSGHKLDGNAPVRYGAKITRANRSTRLMQYMWIGEVMADGEGPRVLALGASGNFEIPAKLIKKYPAILNLRLNAINANGKAYSLESAYQIEK
ncbi:MAG TPA: DUF5060 domain-containing protein, partial [Bryobacteraceae bacterium]|nr:DUF5060 domain-containing protein [Bryobacteraceae bacterium]